MFTKTIKGKVRIPKNKYQDDNEVFSYRGRQISLDKPIQVYRNLTKKCYSIRQNGKVVAHAQKLCISNAKFIVNEKGRDRVRKTGRKEVHAVIQGLYETSGMGTTASKELKLAVKYNPIREDYFTCYNLVDKPVIVKSALFVICGTQITAACIN